jgi:hypothetical protein
MKRYISGFAAALFVTACGGPGNPEYINEVAKRCGKGASSSDAPAPCAALVGSNRDVLTVFGLTEEGQLIVADPVEGKTMLMSRESAQAILSTEDPRVVDP